MEEQGSEDMELILDFVVDEGEESNCGVLVKVNNNYAWLFHDPVHGYYMAIGPGREYHEDM